MGLRSLYRVDGDFTIASERGRKRGELVARRGNKSHSTGKISEKV
jgi:hypothetical protein